MLLSQRFAFGIVPAGFISSSIPPLFKRENLSGSRQLVSAIRRWLHGQWSSYHICHDGDEQLTTAKTHGGVRRGVRSFY